MQIYDLNNDLTQVTGYTARLLAEKISSSANRKSEPEQKHDFTPLSKEQKQNIVSEKLDASNVDQPAGISFQENTPVAKLLESLKSFNEAQKVLADQNSIGDKKSPIDSQVVDDTIYEDSPVGYYIVIDDKPKQKQQKLLKNRFDLIKEKISKTYNLGFRKENGTLVNLTA